MRNFWMTRIPRRVGLTIGATALLLTGCGLSTGPSVSAATNANPPSTVSATQTVNGMPTLIRIHGSNNATIAANLALTQYPHGTKTVIVAPGDAAWADQFAVLAANPLAAADQAPILLSATHTALGAVTATTMTRLHAKTVILVGVDNNPTLTHILKARHYQVVGLGSANPDQTAAALGQALLQATGEVAATTVFVVAPNDIANDLSIASPAALLEDPILVAAPTAQNGAGAIPSDELSLAARASTFYAIGSLTSLTSLTGVPSWANVVDIGNTIPAETANAVDMHFAPFYTPQTVVAVNAAPSDLSADLTVGSYAAAQVAPIIPLQQGTVPTAVQQYLHTLPPNLFGVVALGGSSVVPPAAVNAVNASAGGTVFATLAAQTMAFFERSAKLVHEVFPVVPASGPYADSRTMALVNDPTILKQDHVPPIPVSLKAAGVIPNVPTDQAIMWLTPQVVNRLVKEAQSQTLTSGLSANQVIAGVRFAARAATLNAGNTALALFLTNPQAPINQVTMAHEALSASQATKAYRLALLPGRIWVYRTWVSLSHAQIAPWAPPNVPAGHIVAGFKVTGLTLDIVMSNVFHHYLVIGLHQIPHIFVDVELVQDNGIYRWYAIDETAFFSGNPFEVYWIGPRVTPSK